MATIRNGSKTAVVSARIIGRTCAVAWLVCAALSAATAPSLGTAGSFAVLGGSTVTNTGPTLVNGDLGVSPGSSITGFPVPGTVVPPGTVHAADAVAAQAQNDLTTAYNALAGQACNTDLTGIDLGGLTLLPGVYCFSSSAQLTGALTLDAQGNPNAVFVFQIATTLTTATNSSVNVINGGVPCNIFWQLGTSATLGTTTAFQGSILALASITLNTGATVSGRVLARNGAVTLDSNVITIPNCTGVPTSGLVQICKVAGLGVAHGTFTFNVAGTPVTVSAGPAPGGTCAAAVTVPAGPAVITETLQAGVVLAGVTTLPSAALLISSNLAAGTATVTVPAGGQTTVTFIDAATPAPGIGFVEVCKVAGFGVVPGTLFNFTVGAVPVPVPAWIAPGGLCIIVAVPAGPVAITEAIPVGVVVAGVSTLPASALLSSNLATGTASIMVIAGAQTTITFIDAATAAAGTGFVQVCKVAGAGVATGTNFTFNIAGTPQIIPAGSAPGGTCGAPIAVPVGLVPVTEAIPAGIVVTSVSTLPSPGLLVSSNLATGVATVTVVANGQTIVTFTDAAALALVPPVLAKAFVPAVINVNDITSLIFTLTNPNATALTNVSFSDILPAGLSVATPSGLISTCGGSITTTTGLNSTITVSGVTLNPASSCVISVNVQGVNIGTFTNITSVVTSANTGPGILATAPILVGSGSSFQKAYLAGGGGGGGVTAGVVDLTNAGALGADAFGPLAGTTGRICVNVYVFTADEQETECCSCLVTPNALVHLTAADLTGNPGNGVTPTLGVMVSLLATIPGTTAAAPGTSAGPFSGSSCNAAFPFTGANLAPGMAAWAVQFHNNPTTSPASTSLTETTFPIKTLSPGELNKLTNLC